MLQDPGQGANTKSGANLQSEGAMSNNKAMASWIRFTYA